MAYIFYLCKKKNTQQFMAYITEDVIFKVA